MDVVDDVWLAGSSTLNRGFFTACIVTENTHTYHTPLARGGGMSSAAGL